jgi:heme/copper-type cytochrome/quinol oxidase subunit 2
MIIIITNIIIIIVIIVIIITIIMIAKAIMINNDSKKKNKQVRATNMLIRIITYYTGLPSSMYYVACVLHFPPGPHLTKEILLFGRVRKIGIEQLA